MRTFRYGEALEQEGDLYLPAGVQPPVICLLHGGFWRAIYRRDQLIAIADDLVGRGFAVWNLEYRGIGAGGGWPGTLLDVAAGIDHLAALAAHGQDLDLTRVITVGHSAGGQLALWAAARERASAPGLGGAARVRIRAAVGLAAVADLVEGHRLDLGRGVVGQFLGGAPAERPERYRAASPRALLPLGVPQLLIHGTADDTVPVEIARGYAAAAQAAGDRVTLEELTGGGHFEFLDPDSQAHARLCRWLARWR